MQKCVLLIFWSLPWEDGVFEIEYVLRKETEILVKQIFTFFAFVFHLKVTGFIIVVLSYYYYEAVNLIHLNINDFNRMYQVYLKLSISCCIVFL